ncbi:hypothetical protein PICSAR107_03452 [Mycobacterium avium subsp. paratuberculosis]|nr:hypothetical protein PICSAR107_03452 [Mycobacterium avium subsp. paratuberculosis]
MPAGPETLLGQFALGLAALETLPVRQHHGPDGRGDQQRAGQLEGPQVAGKDQGGKPFHVAVGVGGGQPGEPAAGHVADRGDEQDAEPDTGGHRGDALAAQRLPERFGRVDADEHQHEQEQHHHRAGVDHDLDDAQKQRVLDHVEHRQDDHRHGQEHGRVDGVDGQHHPERTDHGQRAQHPERHCLAGGCADDGVLGIAGGQRGGDGVAGEGTHRGSPARWASRSPCAVTLPR